MTGQTDRKAEKIMSAYLDYIGDQHLENICSDLTPHEEEISQVQVPEGLDAWFNQYIDKYKKKEAHQKFLRKLKTISSRAAVILLVVIASMLIITLSVDAIRIKVFNLLLEINDKYSSVRVEEDPSISIGWKDYYFPDWIPEGFHIKNVRELKNAKIVKFTDDKDQYINFTQAINGTEYQLDTENAVQKEVIIHEQTGILSEKPGKSILFWNNNENSFCLTSSLSGEILEKIARSVKKK